MLPTDINKKKLQHDKHQQAKDKQHKIIDLRSLTTNPDNDIYICEHCDCRLIPYFDVKGKYLTAPNGKLFQCGKCGQMKDTSNQGIHNIKRPEQLTSRGDNNNNIFITHWRQPQPKRPEPFDIDKGDDLMLKGMGFHIVRTRITVNGKILRDDYDNS